MEMATYLVNRWRRKRASNDAMREARLRHLRLEREIRQITECAYPLLARSARSLKISRFCFNTMAMEMMAEVALLKAQVLEWQRRKARDVDLDIGMLQMMWNALNREITAFKIRIQHDDDALKQIEPAKLSLIARASQIF